MRPLDECLLRKKSGGIVTDGLIFWVDGINNTRHGHDETATAWEDLSGNDIDLVHYNTFGKLFPVFDEKSVKFSGNQGLISEKSIAISDYAYVEAVVRFNDTYRSCIVIGNTLSNGFALISKDSLIHAGHINSSPAYVYRAFRVSSVVQYSFYSEGNTLSMNGEQYSNINAGTWSHWKNTMVVGCSSDGSTMKLNGDIYAIRIYDHELSDEEKLQNFKDDIKRFGVEVE